MSAELRGTECYVARGLNRKGRLCRLSAVIRFSSRNWASNIAVPTAVVVTTRDKIVPTRRQLALAATIPGAKQFEVDGDHFACADKRTNFVPELVAACNHVNAAAA